MLAASAAAAAAQGLPPIITVKNVRTHVGPTYKWDVRSTVLGAPAVEQLYPGTTASAKVALAVTRTKAGRGFLVTGKVLVTNPRPNAAPLDVKQVKVAWGPVIPLLTPSPTQLDCEARLLAPGKSMSCSFRTEASTGIIKTMTPQVLIAGLPLMQGQPVPIEWSTDAEPAPGSRAAQDTSGCALISSQVVAGELLQPGVRVSAAKDQADLLTTGVEVCGDSASFTYNIVMVSDLRGRRHSSSCVGRPQLPRRLPGRQTQPWGGLSCLRLHSTTAVGPAQTTSRVMHAASHTTPRRAPSQRMRSCAAHTR
jgi:hypothetical protein